MKKLISALMMTLVLTGCTASPYSEGAQMPNTYRQITTQEAIELMAKEENYLILDVRTRSEYDAGHIPNAILIPNENIGTSELPQLPDKTQLILVYCRSGNRSKLASEKLVKLGYTNIVEFGGINSWTGEIISE